jgi:hypothetical protein
MRVIFAATGKPEMVYRCWFTAQYKVTGVCDVVKPEPEPVDDDGFRVFPQLPEPELCPDGISYKLLEQRWNTDYPACGAYKTVTIWACGRVIDDPERGGVPPTDPGAFEYEP